MTDSQPAANLPEIDNPRAALWMFGAAMCFSVTTVVVKALCKNLPVMEVGFLRCFMGFLALAPVILHNGLGVYQTTRVDLHLIRIVCSSFAILLGVYGIAHLDLATAVSLGFTRPLFMIVLAYYLLHERIHWRRGLATVIGFAGVLVVVGPSDISDIPGAIACLTSAAFVAGAMAVIRHQASIDGPTAIMVWYATGCVITTALPAILVWQTPQGWDWALLVVLGVVGSTGQYMIIRAFTHGEATVVNPIDYSQILVTTLVGYWLYAEVPTVWTIMGAAIIAASTLYIVFRDAKIRKASVYSAV